MNPIIGAGALISAALYETLIFVAAIFDHAPVARNAAILAVGVTYLSYIFQWGATRHLQTGHLLAVASSVLGVLAGVALLMGI